MWTITKKRFETHFDHLAKQDRTKRTSDRLRTDSRFEQIDQHDRGDTDRQEWVPSNSAECFARNLSRRGVVACKRIADPGFSVYSRYGRRL